LLPTAKLVQQQSLDPVKKTTYCHLKEKHGITATEFQYTKA
jgi:hypothetical protein